MSEMLIYDGHLLAACDDRLCEPTNEHNFSHTGIRISAARIGHFVERVTLIKRDQYDLTVFSVAVCWVHLRPGKRLLFGQRNKNALLRKLLLPSKSLPNGERLTQRFEEKKQRNARPWQTLRQISFDEGQICCGNHRGEWTMKRIDSPTRAQRQCWKHWRCTGWRLLRLHLRKQQYGSRSDTG